MKIGIVSLKEKHMNENLERSEANDIKALKIQAIIRVSAMIFILGLAFFLSAWTFDYWQAWVYIIGLLIPMMIFGAHMLKHNPKFLERRMRMKEKRKEQRLILRLGLLPFLASFILPGFDVRFGWSRVPPSLAVTGLALVLAGYLMVLYVFKTNSFASRVVEVEKEQRVITTGPYALVRHPMYTALILFYGATPLALGSYWALFLSVLIIPILVFRIKDEEKELSANLDGYRDYARKVKYRLIPGLW